MAGGSPIKMPKASPDEYVAMGLSGGGKSDLVAG